MFILANIGWPEAFLGVGLSCAIAFAIWAMFKYGNRCESSDIQFPQLPTYFSCEEKPVELNEEED